MFRFMPATVAGAMVLILALLSGCAANGAPPPPTTMPGATGALEEHDGYRGFWLRASSAEAFVALQPQFRVLSLARKGEISLMAGSDVCEQGLRLAFMEPNQVPASFSVGDVPGEVLERSVSSARVRLHAAAGLQYELALKLQDARPILTISASLKNVGRTPRHVACWSVAAFARNGTIIAPFGAQPRAQRRLVLPWWTAWPQPSVTFGRDAVAADAGGAVVGGGAYKVGLLTEPGWIALIRGRRALLSHVPFEPGKPYGEGGNVTFFSSTGSERQWSEIEQVGALRTLQPGESSLMQQSLELLKLESDVKNMPDELRAAIESVRSSPSTQPRP
jgi:hypothetical protein